MLDKAIALAAEKFVGKYDRGGKPYILHCLHVMYAVAPDEELMCAAVLHDIVEDTCIAPVTLIQMGFSDRVIELIVCLTHKENESYETYIQRIALDKDAARIKRADLEHNSQITRMKGLTKKDFDRLMKYHRAYEYLKGV